MSSSTPRSRSATSRGSRSASRHHDTRPQPKPATVYHSEREILKKVKLNLVDDDWPIFPLYDVIVLDKGQTRMENLLYVEWKGPFIIRGRLRIDHDDEASMASFLHPPPRSQKDIWVEVLAMRMSIGLSNRADLWAASEHGFFEIIEPVPAYNSVLSKSREAIFLYYTTLTIYEEEQRKRKADRRRPELALDDVLLKYSVAVGDGAFRHEVVQRCHEHSSFLSRHFEADKSFNWKKTKFYRFILELSTQPFKINSTPSSHISTPIGARMESTLSRRDEVTVTTPAASQLPTTPQPLTTNLSSSSRAGVTRSVSSQAPDMINSPTLSTPKPVQSKAPNLPALRQRPGSPSLNQHDHQPLPRQAFSSSESGKRREAAELALARTGFFALSPQELGKMSHLTLRSSLWLICKFSGHILVKYFLREYADELLTSIRAQPEAYSYAKDSPLVKYLQNAHNEPKEEGNFYEPSTDVLIKMLVPRKSKMRYFEGGSVTPSQPMSVLRGDMGKSKKGAEASAAVMSPTTEPSTQEPEKIPFSMSKPFTPTTPSSSSSSSSSKVISKSTVHVSSDSGSPEPTVSTIQRKPAGKTPALRIRQKRVASTSIEQDVSRWKQAKTGQYGASYDSMEVVSSDDDDSDDSDDEIPAVLPQPASGVSSSSRSSSRASSSTARGTGGFAGGSKTIPIRQTATSSLPSQLRQVPIVVRSKPLDLSAAQGSGYRCAHPGCRFVACEDDCDEDFGDDDNSDVGVPALSVEKATAYLYRQGYVFLDASDQVIISLWKHMLSHRGPGQDTSPNSLLAGSDDSRISLAVEEGQGRSIDHLLDKLRQESRTHYAAGTVAANRNHRDSGGAQGSNGNGDVKTIRRGLLV